MKKIITTFAVAALAMLAAAPLADARPYRGHGHGSHVYVSGYRSCGTPIYTERYFIRYDRRGNPVWGYRTVSHGRPHYRPAPPRHYYHAPVCPPPVHRHRHHRGHGGSGVVIHGTFRF